MSLNKSKSLRTAEKYVLQGKLPAAIDEYRKIVEADPGDLTTINTLGDLYVRAGRIQDAIKNFSRIAESYREGGFTLKAIAMLKKISKLDPTNVDTAMKLANLYSQQGLLVEARQQYLQVADAFARTGQAHKALEAYQKIADLDPSNTSVRLKLGEIYLREGMKEQAHDAFVTAGAELLRKNELEQGLTANLKAIAINPDSRHALTSLATIYTQQGQADKAINLLCDAFERSPGDTELLTILGRTYLASDWLDDAERTFLSLVELDRTRYHYLLEVGRRFLQLENLDRAAELIDGCIDILIAKREEDKAIDFLRRILDHDINHLGALKRLAQIFLRIREDHNLIAALNSVVEAALKKEETGEAVAALKELVRLEPGESSHFQRLQSLGVSDLSDVGTGSAAYTAMPFGQASDEAYIIRQISEAEILAGLGQVDQAVENLNAVLAQSPDSLQIHLKLKDIYLRNGRMKEAAARCLELSHIHEARGETARASDYVAEAKHLYPDIHELQDLKLADASLTSTASSFAFAMNFGEDKKASPVDLSFHEANGNFHFQDPGEAFSFQDTPDHFGFTEKKSADEGGFDFEIGKAAEESSDSSSSFNDWQAAEKSEPAAEASFRYFDTIVSDKGKREKHEEADMVFKATGNLPTDTMPQILRDELEGIDFYIAQGYAEIAKDTLDRLRETYGDHAEILGRYESLGVVPPTPEAVKQQGNGQTEIATDPAFRVNDSGEIDLDLNEAFQESPSPATTDFGPSQADGFAFAEPEPAAQQQPPGADLRFETPRSPQSGERQNVMPFLVHKDSGMLEEQDLILQFNTSELMRDAAFNVTDKPANPAAPTSSPAPPQEALPADDEADALAHLIADVNFADLPKEAAPVTAIQTEPCPAFADASSPLPLPDRTVEEERSLPAQVAEAGPEASALTPEEPGTFQGEKEPLQDSSLPPHVESAALQEVMELGDLLDSEETELQRMLEDLKEDSDSIASLQDYETHYSLGLAYKDMDLLDEAIEQFQLAFRLAASEGTKQHHIECCHMLGFCFRRKYMPKVAVMWFQRGLKIADSSEDEYQALRYEIGSCYEEMGETDKALDTFMEVYGIDVNYRDVSRRVRDLQVIKNT